MADRPSDTGREDTVALPLPPKRPAPGSNGTTGRDGSGSSSGANGSGRVLPPMPAETTGERTAAPPPKPPAARPTRTTAKKTARPPAKASPATPPAQAAPSPQSARPTEPAPPPPVRRAPTKAAPAKAAPTRPAPTTPPPTAARQPSPATQATQTARTTETVRPASAPPPVVAPAPAVTPAAKVKPAKEPRPPKPTREEKRAEKIAAAPKAGRRARLRLTRIDPWSVMKTSFLLSIALGIVIVVSVLMVWSVLGAADVWSSINQTVQDVVGGQDASTFDIEDYLGTRRVVGFTMIVAAVDVVLVTAICTLGAFLYNMSASLLGGIEVTLAEDH
jgi:hypothetical protein